MKNTNSFLFFGSGLILVAVTAACTHHSPKPKSAEIPKPLTRFIASEKISAKNLRQIDDYRKLFQAPSPRLLPAGGIEADELELLGLWGEYSGALAEQKSERLLRYRRHLEVLTRKIAEQLAQKKVRFVQKVRTDEDIGEVPLFVISSASKRTKLNAAAADLDKRSRGVKMVYDPHRLTTQGALGMFSPWEGILYLGARDVAAGDLSPVSAHEVDHAQIAMRRKNGASRELWGVLRAIESHPVKPGEAYASGFSLDEMSLFASHVSFLSRQAIGHLGQRRPVTELRTHPDFSLLSAHLETIVDLSQGVMERNRELLELLAGVDASWSYYLGSDPIGGEHDVYGLYNSRNHKQFLILGTGAVGPATWIHSDHDHLIVMMIANEKYVSSNTFDVARQPRGVDLVRLYGELIAEVSEPVEGFDSSLGTPLRPGGAVEQLLKVLKCRLEHQRQVSEKVNRDWSAARKGLDEALEKGDSAGLRKMLRQAGALKGLLNKQLAQKTCRP